MKIEIKNTDTIEINLPYYCKGSIHFFKIFSQEKCLMINTLKGGEAISIVHAGLPFDLNDSEGGITASDFHDKFNEVLTILATK